MPYLGRFAPSPTGPLHFGSLVTAVASYLAARSQQGRWLVRIEDLDPPRVQQGASDLILQTLTAYGFEWDGEVVYQSSAKCQRAYTEALQQLMPYIYPCYCSRKQLQHTTKQGQFGTIYADTCRHLTSTLNKPAALRIKTPDQSFRFHDQIYGEYSQQLHADIGDFVIKRADGWWAYQLAVVVDDAIQGITHIVRGADLLDNTPRQLYLQQLLNYHRPQYTHIPLVLDQQGQKLSKQSYAPALALDAHTIHTNIFKALVFLKQSPPSTLIHESTQTLWDWAIKHWTVQPLTHDHSQSTRTVS